MIKIEKTGLKFKMIVWNKNRLCLGLKTDTGIHANFSRGFECKVIGKIYESPETLKKYGEKEDESER